MAEKLSGSLKALYQSIREDDRINSTGTQGVCDYKYFSPKRNSSISMKGKINIGKRLKIDRGNIIPKSIQTSLNANVQTRVNGDATAQKLPTEIREISYQDSLRDSVQMVEK